MRRHDTSVSEIEFCNLYVVAERWILGCILRFMHAKNHFSDTLIPIAAISAIRRRRWPWVCVVERGVRWVCRAIVQDRPQTLLCQAIAHFLLPLASRKSSK